MRRLFLVACVAIALRASPSLSEEQILPSASDAKELASPCDVHAAINAADVLLKSVPVHYDEKIVGYTEMYRDADGKLHPQNHTDYQQREIPLVLFRSSTCDIRLLVITRIIRNGQAILLPPQDAKVKIEIEERAVGKIWNGYNTPYVVTPNDWVVVRGKWKAIRSGETFTYTPFSRTLQRAFPQLIEDGREHFDADLIAALRDLKEKKVPSKAFPGQLVADTTGSVFMNDFRIIPLAEHSDDVEVQLYAQGKEYENPFKKVHATIGANGNAAYQLAISDAGAAGLMQIWPQTCHGKHKKEGLRKDYPEALLPTGCTRSPEDTPHGHIEAIKTAVLHYDSDLAKLIEMETKGFLGPLTRAFLRTHKSEKAAKFLVRNLGQGATGEDVRALQKWLAQNNFSVTADGTFGAQTKLALAQYQKSHIEEIRAVILTGDKILVGEVGRILFAAYNGGMGRVGSALLTHFDQWDQPQLKKRRVRGIWRMGRDPKSLRPETVSYLVKFDIIKKNILALFPNVLVYK